jgi:Cd2+/Zn2+-exporting ATPase
LKIYLPVIGSLLLLVVGIAIDNFADGKIFSRQVRLCWYLLAYLPVGWPVLKEAWEALVRKEIFNEFTLMSLATLGAFLIGEYPEGVAVMLFYSAGELFQEAAVKRAKRNINALLEARPDAATVMRGDATERVAPETVAVGERVEVKAGERVPLDGVLLEQPATFNTAALTGESLPREIEPGGEVLAGMIAVDRVARVTVTRPFAQSALARILRLVQDAAERKAPVERFIHRFARIYTPIVVALALGIVLVPWGVSLFAPDFTYQFGEWFRRGLVFLVIACPCALVISIPLGYFGGIGAASRRGILFKGGNYLDAVTRLNTVVMDKTGTLTRGLFEVQQVSVCPGIKEEEFLRVVASVEASSTHPIAKAIVRHGERLALPLSVPDALREIAGCGIEATVEGQAILVGNARLLDRASIPFPDMLRSTPGTVILCALDGRYAGHVVVADTPKEDAGEAIVALRQAGIRHLVMLSGDASAIVTALAARLGIEEAYGDLLPEGKVAHLERLKAVPGACVAFVGDGINDAPVLALSDVGIAMGGLGSDVAIETADVVIQTDQPIKIATAIRIGRRTRRVVIQNILLAFGVKLLVLALGAAGLATLWEAVFADVGVALLAVFNASRLLVNDRRA